jgi:hypothetical protein
MRRNTVLVLLTAFHVAASLIGIFTGASVVFGLLRSQIKPRTAAWFLGSTAAAVASGFLFNPGRVTMGVIGLGQIDGLLSLIVLVPTWLALYRHRLAGNWRSIYAAGATALLYLNMVILVLQLFGKIAALRVLISGPSDPLFVAVQAVLLATFVLLGKLAVDRFRPVKPIVLHPATDAPFGRLYSIDELWRL